MKCLSLLLVLIPLCYGVDLIDQVLHSDTELTITSEHGLTRAKRQSEADKREVEAQHQKELWKTEYLNYLQWKRNNDIEQHRRETEAFHEKRRAQLKLILQEAKTRKDAELAGTLPVIIDNNQREIEAFHEKRRAQLKLILQEAKTRKAAELAGTLPVIIDNTKPKQQPASDVALPATTSAPIQSTTLIEDETTLVNLRVPAHVYKRLNFMFTKFNSTTMELTPEEEAEIEKNFSTSTTEAPSTTTQKSHHYVKVAVPENVYHKLWRFFKKYALHIGEDKKVKVTNTGRLTENDVNDDNVRDILEGTSNGPTH